MQNKVFRPIKQLFLVKKYLKYVFLENKLFFIPHYETFFSGDLEMDINSLDNETEKQVLALWACSQTAKESARYLGISVRSVNYYREKLRCRLGVHTSNQLINRIIFMENFESLIRIGKEYLLDNKKAQVSV